MDTRNIYAIFKKEIFAYLYNPTTYLIAGVFIAVWEFLFFQNVFVAREASLQYLFALLPWFFLILIPAITMGSISEEVNNETLEILLTHPIRDRELILGKFLSAMAFTSVILLASLPIAITLKKFSDLDMGVYFGQYFAALLFASALTGLGIGVSAFFRNQVPALMVSVVSIFVLILMGTEMVTMSLPEWLGAILSRLSVLPHFSSIARGVLDIRDIWYFLLFTVIFLELAHMKLLARRTSQRSKKVMQAKSLLLILTTLLVVTSGFGLFPSLRADLTDGKIYTLTDSTKNILAGLEADIEIVLYESPNLPAELQPRLRTTKDILKDYVNYGGSKLTVTYKNPDADPSMAQEANEAGVGPVQVRSQGKGELQLRQLYLGIAVQSGDDIKSIPFIETTSDLEYLLTSFISEITRVDRKKIGFLDIARKTSLEGFSILSGELKKQFTVVDITLTEASSTIPDDLDTLIVARPTGKMDDLYETAVRKYLNSGKNALFLMDGVEVNMEYMMALPNGTTTDTLLDEYGITVHQDMVYDLRSNKMVQAGNNILPYPAFVQAGVTQGAFAGSNLTNITILWGSTVSVNESVVQSKGMQSIPLIYTSQTGGVQKENYILDPQGAYPQSNLGQKILGVLLKPQEDAEEGDPISRIIVLGDSDLISDAYIQGVPENFAFGLEAISYLAKENSLAGIKLKQEASHALIFNSPEQTVWVQYGNMAGVLIILIGVGAVLIGRRRKMRTVTYKEGKNL